MAFKLPRLTFNWQSQPQLFERYWDTVLKELEKVINQILDIPAIQAALANLDTAVAAANTAADNANNAAAAASAETSLVSSFPTGFTPPLISADSSGNVTIANHNREYGDSTTVAVTGATISTGATASQIVRVYYVDPSRAGGAVTYLFTVDPATPVPQTGDNHSVGAVVIPAAGTNNGNGVTPPGYVEP